MEKIRCKVLHIRYSKPENGYQVFSACREGEDRPFCVFGSHYIVTENSILDIEGEWIVDPKYGHEFKASSWSEVLPSTKEGIENYLSSSLVHGIGPKLAKIIVEALGEDTFDVIKNNTERLCSIPGIGIVRARRISENIRKQDSIRDIMVFLQSYGISPAYAMKIYRAYELTSVQKMKENPYCLCNDVVGIGFKTADKIAISMGYEMTSFHRLSTGILYVMGETVKNGHVFQNREELLSLSKEELSVDVELIESALCILLSEDKLYNDEGRIYLPKYYYSEIGIALKLDTLMRYSTYQNSLDFRFDKQRKDSYIEYNTQQINAIQTALSSKVMVLTGGPGTGKTTVVKGIISMMSEKYSGEERILLAAPTGRAAKRMSEATDLPAKTIHRLLEYKGSEGFQRNEENKLEGNVLIVDESSMIDSLLMYALLEAIPSHMQLILVGDVDQLPSVGAGNVLHDIIDSHCIPVVRLTEVFRQAAQSHIITNAHRINAGMMPNLQNKKDGDFFFIPANTDEEAANIVVSLMSERLEKVNFYPDDIQVLTPMRKRSSTGCDNLNSLLQESLNPDGKILNFPGKFREGDRVMQVKNNYDYDVYNGDIGSVSQYNEELDRAVIIYQNRSVLYRDFEMSDLSLSYATTIHKSQGSEYPVVIIPILNSAYMMLQRNLLYTAITRAKKLCIIVGDKQAIWRCVSNGVLQKRNTMLRERLIEIFNN